MPGHVAAPLSVNRVPRSGAVGLQVYLKTCRTQHGAATLSCKPKTGHHTKGLATACISSKCVSFLGSKSATACPNGWLSMAI